ncbi:MAG: hypothetical protein HQK79_17950 [Desulfobacterales bacterium]|nr:hypothetical protein [Desulfobacterales bacterium]
MNNEINLNIEETENKLITLENEFEANLRLDIYIIDSGWDDDSHIFLNQSMDLIKSYVKNHNCYIFSHEQSLKFLTSHPELIGKDPIIVVVDRLAKKLNNPEGFGARLMLGEVQDKSRIEWLIKMFLKVVNTHCETLDIAFTFKEYNYKQGLKGAVDIIIESFAGHH